MKVTIVYQYYQGHDSPGHSLVYELAQHLTRRHDVSVVSGEAGYMDRKRTALPWYRRLKRTEQDGQVQVVRTYTYVEKTRNTLGRVLNFISFALSCPLGVLSVRKPDIVLASSPPIMPMFTAALVCRLRRIPFVIEVRDLWPSSAVEMGILRNKKLIAVMSWMEKFLYNHSKAIVALTEGIKSDIVARGWSPDKVEVVTCGVDFERLFPDAEGARKVRDAHGWDGKTVIMYFGALGIANNIPVILQAARLLRNRTDILFVLIGDGAKKGETVATIEQEGLANVQVLDPVAKDRARNYLSAADVGLATLLDIALFNGAIPTKLLDYMACEKPVLCGIRGEAEHIMTKAEAGVCFEPNDGEALARLVEQTVQDPAKRADMGAAGLKYVRQHFSALTAREKMERILSKAAGHRDATSSGDRP